MAKDSVVNIALQLEGPGSDSEPLAVADAEGPPWVCGRFWTAPDVPLIMSAIGRRPAVGIVAVVSFSTVGQYGRPRELAC
jgi:hypothetical protein